MRILQVGKLSVSFLIECESPMVVQLIGGRAGIQNCLIPKTHALSSSYFLLTYLEQAQNGSPLSFFAISW